MRIGQFISFPNEYSRYGSIRDERGYTYTVDASQIPKGASKEEDYAYKVEIWGNDSGLAYDIKED